MSEILVLTSSETGGDLYVTMAVALGLSQRGHSVRFVGDEGVTRVAGLQGIEATALPPELQVARRMVRASRQSKGAPARKRGELLRNTLLEWAREVAPAVENIVQQAHPDLLLTSLGVAPVGENIAGGSTIPWVVVSGTFYVGPNAPRPLEEDFSAGMVPVFESIRSSLDAASLVIHGTWPAFDFSRVELPSRHRYVGPLFWEAPGTPPQYLTEPGDPWVLATLSSMTHDDIPLGQTILDALADRAVRVLLTTGANRDMRFLLRTPPNARIEPYVPHSAVLQRSDLFVSYGGTGAVMKALWFGVPMVLVPWGGIDRPGVAARAERLGAARVIQPTDLTPAILADAVECVLAEDQYRAAARAVARELQASDPVALACTHIEGLLVGAPLPAPHARARSVEAQSPD
ncbi:MAG TPA: nucleotide disphospho-sugar-binding domain-containing protein [Chloroflexota bacterium]